MAEAAELEVGKDASCGAGLGHVRRGIAPVAEGVTFAVVDGAGHSEGQGSIEATLANSPQYSSVPIRLDE